MVEEDAGLAVGVALVAEGVLDLGLLARGGAGEDVRAHRDGNLAVAFDLMVLEDDVGETLAAVDREAAVLGDAVQILLGDPTALPVVAGAIVVDGNQTNLVARSTGAGETGSILVRGVDVNLVDSLVRAETADGAMGVVPGTTVIVPEEFTDDRTVAPTIALIATGANSLDITNGLVETTSTGAADAGAMLLEVVTAADGGADGALTALSTSDLDRPVMFSSTASGTGAAGEIVWKAARVVFGDAAGDPSTGIGIQTSATSNQGGEASIIATESFILASNAELVDNQLVTIKRPPSELATVDASTLGFQEGDRNDTNILPPVNYIAADVEEPIELSGDICSPDSADDRSSFVDEGKGGVPASPDDFLSAAPGTVNTGTIGAIDAEGRFITTGVVALFGGCGQ